MDEDRPTRPLGRGQARPAPRKGRLRLLVLGLLLLAGIGAGTAALLHRRGVERREAGEKAYADAPTLEAEALVRAWRTDAAGFDKQHQGRALAVSGVVDAVSSVEGAYGVGKVLKVFLRGSDGIAVLCQVDPEHAAAAADLTSGTRVTLVGRYAGDDGYGSLVLRFARRR